MNFTEDTNYEPLEDGTNFEPYYTDAPSYMIPRGSLSIADTGHQEVGALNLASAMQPWSSLAWQEFDTQASSASTLLGTVAPGIPATPHVPDYGGSHTVDFDLWAPPAWQGIGTQSSNYGGPHTIHPGLLTTSALQGTSPLSPPMHFIHDEALAAHFHAPRQPTSMIGGFYYDPVLKQPKLFWRLENASGPFPSAHYKSVGYFFIQDVGMFPYYSRCGVTVKNDHVRVGYLQCGESPVDLEAAVWHYFKDPEYLDPSSPTMEALMSFLNRRVGFGGITIIHTVLKGLTTTSPQYIFQYPEDKECSIMEHGSTMAFSQFSALIPPELIHPAQQYLRTALLGDIDDGPWDSEPFQEVPTTLNKRKGATNKKRKRMGVENKDADEDEDEREDRHEDEAEEGGDDSIYVLNSSAIKKNVLKTIAPNLYKVINDTGIFFQGQFLQGRDFPSAWVEYHPSAIPQAEKGEVTHMRCEEAWRASMAFRRNQRLACETTYTDPACPDVIQVMSENRYFKHVVDKRVRAGKGLHDFVTEHVTLALKHLGHEEFLKQFGPLRSQVEFESLDRVNETLAITRPGFNLKRLPFQNPAFAKFLKELFNGPSPLSLKDPHKKYHKVVALDIFASSITDDVIALGAAAWLYCGRKVIFLDKSKQLDVADNITTTPDIKVWGEFGSYNIQDIFKIMRGRVAAIAKDADFCRFKLKISS